MRTDTHADARKTDAHAIANALGTDWRAENLSADPHQWDDWTLIRSSDDLHLGLRWTRHDYYKVSERNRLAIALDWPRDPDTKTVYNLRTPHGEPEPVTKITVSSLTPHATIARAILSRLVNKDAARLHAEAVARMTSARSYENGIQATIARILEAHPFARPSRNSDPHTLYMGTDSQAYAVRVDGPDSIRFEAFSAPADAALRILDALRKAVD